MPFFHGVRSALAVLLCASAGCGKPSSANLVSVVSIAGKATEVPSVAPNATVSPAGSDIGSADAATLTAAPDERIEAAPRVTSLAHDFGVLRPGASVTHSFEIVNDSDVAWTLKEITRKCNCTVASLSQNPIGPGESAEAIVNYHAPSKYADDRKTLDIYFAESASPAIQIRVHAKIRPVVWLSQQSAQFASRRGSDAEKSLDVANFGAEDWNEISFTSDAPWLSASAALLDDAPPEIDGRQKWRITLSAATGDHQCGTYSSRLRVRCGSEEAWLPVSLRVTGAIEAIPPSMFFGSFDESGRAACDVRLRCIDAPAREIQRSLTVEHDLDDWLKLEVSPLSEKFLLLKGVLTVPGPVEAVKGSIRLHLNDTANTVIEMPLSALR